MRISGAGSSVDLMRLLKNTEREAARAARSASMNTPIPGPPIASASVSSGGYVSAQSVSIEDGLSGTGKGSEEGGIADTEG